MRLLLKSYLLLLIIAATAPVSPTASAAGISVSPAKLDVALSQPQGTTTITVNNPTADVQVFTVSADDFQQAIAAQPASFTLESGDHKTVTLYIDGGKLSLNGSAVLATNISVVGKPLADNKLSFNTAVKVPITIHASSVIATTTPAASSVPPANSTLLWKIISGILLILIIVGGLIKLNKPSAS